MSDFNGNITERSGSVDERIKNPYAPLVIYAAGTPVVDGRRNSLTSDISTNAGLLTMLEREHRVNRIQAAQLGHEREQVRRLRMACDSMTGINGDVESSPIKPEHDTSAVQSDSFDETEHVQKQIAELTDGLDSCFHYVQQLQDAVGALTSRLDEVMAPQDNRRDSHSTVREVDGPLQVARAAFADMGVGELNQASLALGSALHNAQESIRIDPNRSTEDSHEQRKSRSGRRPQSQLYEMDSSNCLAAAVRSGAEEKKKVTFADQVKGKRIFSLASFFGGGKGRRMSTA